MDKQTYVLLIDSCVSNCGEEYDRSRTGAQARMVRKENRLVIKGRTGSRQFGTFCEGAYTDLRNGDWQFNGTFDEGEGHRWYHKMLFESDEWEYVHGVYIYNDRALSRTMGKRLGNAKGWEATWRGSVCDE